ncbi:hypothetical protein C8T65DRAFT_744654 [Cerioporus squamosus]|nr:hypothetical protein C8T65DRAFT_744654 [Cerioporus squamosus]
MDPAPDAFIRAFLLHRTLYHNDSDHNDSDESDEQQTSGQDAATKAMIDLAIFASQAAYKVATAEGAERAEAYARATDSLKTRVDRTRRALRQGMMVEGYMREEDEDTGDDADREDAVVYDGHGAQDTTVPECTPEELVELQAEIMGERVMDAFEAKMESSVVPGLKLQVDAHVEQRVLPGLEDRVNAHVISKISDLEDRVDRRVDTRIDDYLKSILLAPSHPLHDALRAILLPQRAASPPSTATVVPLSAIAGFSAASAPGEHIETGIETAAPTAGVKREFSPSRFFESLPLLESRKRVKQRTDSDPA